MGASELLKYLEVAAVAVSAILGGITALLGFSFRKEIVRAEKRKAAATLRRGREAASPETPRPEPEVANVG